jgi:hypothetical protein
MNTWIAKSNNNEHGFVRPSNKYSKTYGTKMGADAGVVLTLTMQTARKTNERTLGRKV